MTSERESLAMVVPNASPLVEARAVCKRFSDGNVTAVDDVSLTIAKGQFAAR